MNEHIKCPFLRHINSSATTIYGLASDCSKHGFSFSIAFSLIFYMTLVQKGIVAAFTMQSLDIYRLDHVPSVSHKDLFCTDLARTREKKSWKTHYF